MIANWIRIANLWGLEEKMKNIFLLVGFIFFTNLEVFSKEMTKEEVIKIIKTRCLDADYRRVFDPDEGAFARLNNKLYCANLLKILELESKNVLYILK